MKTYLTLFLILLVQNTILINYAIAKNHLKKSQQNEDILIKQLFSSTQKAACESDPKVLQNKADEIQKKRQIKKAEEDKPFINTGKSDMWWVKPWGYGDSARLFDYLIPVLKDVFIKEAKETYEELKKISNKSTKKYPDPFDYMNFITKDMSEDQKNKMMSNWKLINPNYEKGIYENSINAVQLNKAIPIWKWNIDPTQSDYAKDYVKKFDADGDGRLNPRELILAIIEQNKEFLGRKGKQHLFNQTVNMLEAMFSFIDCDSAGFISAEQIWKKFKYLNRSSKKYNIYALKPELRTKAVNDFVLKSHESKNGLLNKTEFITGMLYGFWNRYTSEKAILTDESRSLTDLRWTDDGMADKEITEIITKKQ